MISIFIMYSTDRSEALDYTINCLRSMSLYEDCQKTLIVDGKIDKIPRDWEALQVPRIKNQFCWGRMWDAGVLSANNEKIVYLDSDRLLPATFLELVEANCQDDLFIFTSKHFQMKSKPTIEQCKATLQSESIADVLCDPVMSSLLVYEERHGDPFHGPGKNVMSGSVAFTRETYLRLGGVDQWYCGHGAFADTDFHMQAASNGCEFLDLDIPELHFPHDKLNNDNTKLSDKDLWKKSLDNFIYYCLKWELPLVLAEDMAARGGIKRPSNYVSKKSKEIKEFAKVSC